MWTTCHGYIQGLLTSWSILGYRCWRCLLHTVCHATIFVDRSLVSVVMNSWSLLSATAVKLLLDSGWDPNIGDEKNRSPLDQVCPYSPGSVDHLKTDASTHWPFEIFLFDFFLTPSPLGLCPFSLPHLKSWIFVQKWLILRIFLNCRWSMCCWRAVPTLTALMALESRRTVVCQDAWNPCWVWSAWRRRRFAKEARCRLRSWTSCPLAWSSSLTYTPRLTNTAPFASFTWPGNDAFFKGILFVICNVWL
jgi:hypothetical protein